MSYIRSNYRRYGPGVEFTETPETDYTCPICGEDIAWWREPYDFYYGKIICKKCIERIEPEVDYG